MEMEGRVAIVTGGSRGIGFAIAGKLLDLGSKVCISGVKQENGDTALEKLKENRASADVIFIQCDVSKPSQLDELFQRTVDQYKRLDVVINNAGVLQEKRWEVMVRINLDAVIRGTYLALHYMGKDSGGLGGVVVNIGSSASLIVSDLCPVYIATKHAVKGFTESVGMTSLSRQGVRVNAVCPSLVNTGMMKESLNPELEAEMTYGPDGARRAREYMLSSPVSEPEDVAVAAIGLLLDETVSGRSVFVLGDTRTMSSPCTDLSHLSFTPISQ